MTRLQVRAFGRLQLRRADRVVDDFPTHQVAELLGYLLLNRHTYHPREKLMGLLWPNGYRRDARVRLSTTLWRLRMVFEQLDAPADAYIETGRDWLCFKPRRPITLDVADFKQHLAEAEQTSDPYDREQALWAAIALYRGQLYPGIYAEWCLLERERLERAYLQSLGQLMDVCIQRDEYEEAVALGRRILHSNPLREGVHRAVMHCYWRLGRQAQAARQFQQCARLLRKELGMLPTPDTIALYRKIVGGRLARAESTRELPR